MTAMIDARRGTFRLAAAVTATALAFGLGAGVAAAKPKPAPHTSTEELTPPVATSTGWEILADDATHQATVWHNGVVVRTMPISMGKRKDATPNGVYHTKEKYQSLIMSSATYGVPVDSPDGYSETVYWATRMSWDGIFIHAAPWSVASQGKTDVSHGCINISTANGKWVYENLPEGTPIVVEHTSGGQYQGD
ncbi:hypothetical protein GCM10023147_04860 [Tsukamurella soli]|uniref:L,D-TPase catalytic domain-containing protein n=1 Tax=Tsukamurella soli TaxID=644556 RepID=A0ABP8J3J9_9ACTN